jgi:hypothetical protein
LLPLRARSQASQLLQVKGDHDRVGADLSAIRRVAAAIRFTGFSGYRAAANPSGFAAAARQIAGKPAPTGKG